MTTVLEEVMDAHDVERAETEEILYIKYPDLTLKIDMVSNIIEAFPPDRAVKIIRAMLNE